MRPRGFGAFGSLCVYASHVRLPKTSGPHAQEARPAAFLWQAGGNSRGFSGRRSFRVPPSAGTLKAVTAARRLGETGGKHSRRPESYLKMFQAWNRLQTANGLIGMRKNAKTKIPDGKGKFLESRKTHKIKGSGVGLAKEAKFYLASAEGSQKFLCWQKKEMLYEAYEGTGGYPER